MTTTDNRVAGSRAGAALCGRYLQRPLRPEGEYLGEIDLDFAPVQGGKIRFMYDGKIEVGRVDAVDPPDWDRHGVIPTIRVVQSRSR